MSFPRNLSPSHPVKYLLIFSALERGEGGTSMRNDPVGLQVQLGEFQLEQVTLWSDEFLPIVTNGICGKYFWAGVKFQG